MFCSQCSTPVPDTATFCHSCGSLVSDAEGQADASGTMDSSAFRRLEGLLKEDTAGEFELEGILGKGGMAVVYLAREIRLGRQVAIKVLPPELTFGHGIERFLREARTSATLAHPNIIPIYRISSGEEIFWYAMQYIAGQSLDEILKERGRLPLGETITILDQVANALEYAHEHHVVHRDIKPANVMISTRGRVAVADFGIAKALTQGTITASGSVVGTPYYMSPEQGMGKSVTGAADQYSVAVMAFRMLSGQVPFEGGSAVDILHKHCMIAPPRLEELNPDLPEHVFRAVHKGLEKNPADRLSSVATFVQALGGPTRETDSYVAPPAGALDDRNAISALPSGSGMNRISTEIIDTGALKHARARRRLRGAGVAFVVIAGVVGTYQMTRAPAAPALGTVSVVGLPLGSTIEVDGQERQSPFSLPEGPYDVVMRAPNIQDLVKSIRVVSGDTAHVVFDAPPLEALHGVVTVVGLPAGGTVVVQGQERQSPFSLSDGEHEVLMRAPRFFDYRETVTVVPGSTVEIEFDGRAIPARPTTAALTVEIFVGGRATWAQVELDGQPMGQQRSFTRELTAGVMHRLVLARDNFVTKDTTVLLQAGDSTTVRFNLERSQ